MTEIGGEKKDVVMKTAEKKTIRVRKYYPGPKIRLDRLRKLAEHVLHGKRIHDRFDITVFHSNEEGCKSAGCLMGECPAIWKQFSFDPVSFGSYNIFLTLKEDTEINFDACEIWFGLTSYETFPLFDYGHELNDDESKTLLKPMGERVSARVAANRLLKFCDLVESGKYKRREEE